MANIARCSSSSGRHKWRHEKNIMVKSETLTHVTLSLKGRYKFSHCGRVKYGSALITLDQTNAP